jgi:NitT/TauT family transport system substrate-binding protein
MNRLLDFPEKLRYHVTGAIAAVAIVVGAFGIASAQTTQTLRIGTTPYDAGAQPYYAAALGYFRDEGINVEITAMSSGAAIAAAVASGAIDIAQSNIVSLASAHEKGIPFVVIAPASMYLTRFPQTALIVRSDSTVRSAKDLTGKILGVNGLKNIAEVGASAWIDANGGSAASVKYVEVSPAATAAALASGRIDAAILSEPELSEALTHGNRILGSIYDAISKQFMIGAWFTTQDFARSHPELIRRYARIMLKTAQWANKNHAASGKILEAQTKTPVTSSTSRVIYGETLDPREVQAPIDAAARYGALKAPFAASDLLVSTP